MKETKGTEKQDAPAEKSEEQWKEVLSKDQYIVLRQKGTEAPFTGKYYANKEKGTYLCAACGQELFSSDTKYDSGSGWPSFFKPLADDKVTLKEDHSHFMERTEVVCSRCGSHLGHVFDDGPKPTGKRFCMNSISMDFKKEE
ncbi:peptide-methionine (R)-S-oxide reductase MsrB [Methanolobus profundi]|uniref:Peptide methionine sulfoxide reductase MsrB n=1 Tax=Methanolobus profundi TaxID=487685 RepID=A0A1I4SVE5_9EURY|nr:peptide-methionine (R)-S-oxide reductase MsrB [Methanolobus profundi]SFM68466.1 peptide-methionine (R)-S-oxide reductase [Methanolobus profundi]